MSENADEIAKRYDALIAEGREGEGLVPVKARTGKAADVVYSTRYSRDEIALIREAAAKKGIPPTAFIRAAALAAAAGQLDLDSAGKAGTLTEVQAKVRELMETVERLTA